MLATLKNTADYQRQAALSDDETASLEKIALECERDIAAQDKKAEAFNRKFRETLPKSNPTKRPMPVPAELTQMQEERDAIVIRYRDRLRRALGEDAFRRFSQAAKNIVHMTLTPIQ